MIESWVLHGLGSVWHVGLGSGDVGVDWVNTMGDLSFFLSSFCGVLGHMSCWVMKYINYACTCSITMFR